MEALLWSGLQHCGAALEADGGVIAALLLAGLMGGVSHCVGMCGPFVLGQVTARLEAVPADRMREWHRLVGAAAVPYHLGRATTYAGLGAVAASLAGGLAMLSGLRDIAAALLIVAAVVFLAGALRQAGLVPSAGTSGTGVAWPTRLLRPLFARPVGWRGYLLGVALGFLPCGLLYGAIAAAASTGSPLSGALGMAAFAVGTAPALIATGLAGHLAARHLGPVMRVAAPALMIVNAGFLMYMAWRLAA
ncbi:MAG: sulfite exporter TauE/SafE family protein [Alphaproteobacteria bacterium]|nr:sulfite exporter TauE/SafE family protein [Alphaproteobacteria bacterium]